MSDGLRKDMDCPCDTNCKPEDCLDPHYCRLQPGDFRCIREAKEGKGRLFLMTPDEMDVIVARRHELGLNRFGQESQPL